MQFKLPCGHRLSHHEQWLTDTDEKLTQRRKDRQAGLQVASRKWQVASGKWRERRFSQMRRRLTQMFVMLSDRRERSI